MRVLRRVFFIMREVKLYFLLKYKNALPYFMIFLAIHFDLVHVKNRIVYLNFKDTMVHYAEEKS